MAWAEWLSYLLSMPIGGRYVPRRQEPSLWHHAAPAVYEESSEPADVDLLQSFFTVFFLYVYSIGGLINSGKALGICLFVSYGPVVEREYKS